MIKPIPDWLSEDGETSKYQCVICGTDKSVKYAIYGPDPDDKAFLPHCNRCILRYYEAFQSGHKKDNRNTICAITDEIWKLKEKCFDVEDEKVGQILYALCSILQQVVAEMKR